MPRTRRGPSAQAKLVMFLVCVLFVIYLTLARDTQGCGNKNSFHVTFLEIGQYGRLGNQLFQMASTIGIAESHCAKWSFPTSIGTTSVGKLFGLKGDSRLEPLSAVRYDELNETYYRIELPRTRRVVSLHGYFQSRQFFDKSASTLRKHMKISHQLLRKVQKRVPEVQDVNSVTMHVRRGDFKLYPGKYYTLDMTYYSAALNEISTPIDSVIVVTDDADWCMKNIIDRIPFKTILSPFYGEEDSELLDFVLLYLGKHTITANSSFSWWAAFLKQLQSSFKHAGTVVAPDQWYDPTGELTHLNTHSFYPPSWKLVHVDMNTMVQKKK